MSNLLKEAQIRRFMKLASIGTISENFFTEAEEEEVELDLADPGAGEEAAEAAEVEGEAEAELDMDMGAEAGADVAEQDVVDIVATIADALESKYGIAVDVEGGAEEGGDELEAELDTEEPAIEEPAADGGEEELEMLEMVDDEEVVAEVLKRVTARLRKAIKENKRTKITRK
tara:strand:- start:197 stop:715 length:519 start_codon:yes stop_codon:yes gene_type:complete